MIVTPRRIGLTAGCLAAILTLATLRGPGLTIDEPLDVRPGRDYVSQAQRAGWTFFEQSNVDLLFRDNAEHPPLGRWLLGIASKLFEPFEVWVFGPDPTGLYVLAARIAPAMIFAALVGLVAFEASRRWGAAAGIVAGWSLLVSPRVFAHAHLAALDTFLSYFWTLALLAAARAVDSRRPVAAMFCAGLLWGLALLTKIHAWFLPPLIVSWTVLRLRSAKSAAALAVWGVAGVSTFVAGWPWLWYDFPGRLGAFWGTGVQRASIQVEYFGSIWADRDVPWHYPWLYFAVTVPVLLHVLGAIGLGRAWRNRRDDPFPLLLASSIALFLVLFSTRVPAYDGERLFLLVFPAWSMLIGLGFSRLWTHWRSRRTRSLLIGLTICQAFGVIGMHPFGLSYYNGLVGGLAGAERLGLEPTYWGDAVDRPLLDELARRVQPGDVVALAPTLYPGQGVATTTAALLRKNVVIEDESSIAGADWILVSRRRAYWSPELVRRLESPEAEAILLRRRQGVWLGGLWRTSPPSRSPQVHLSE